MSFSISFFQSFFDFTDLHSIVLSSRPTQNPLIFIQIQIMEHNRILKKKNHLNKSFVQQLQVVKKNQKYYRMQVEEFKYIYDDLKLQIKQIPHLQQLLRLAEKSTKKLECINLYSISDKREFDLQLQESLIMQQVVKLYETINLIKQTPTQTLIQQIQQKMQTIKNKNIQTFDLLNKQDQLLSQQVESVHHITNEDHHDNQIKQQDQFDDQYMKDSNNVVTNEQRVASLKKQIDDILAKINKINNGRGKWLASDHNDFVKIYNRCGGNDKKIIEEGVKILGMKNTEIMDHLEIYENYLQLEKQKKIITQEYKQIKLYEKMQEQDKKQKEQKILEEKRKQKKQKQMQEKQKIKEQVQKFKQKKQEEKIKMIEEHQKKQKQKIIKIPVPPSKKKQIIQRNQKYIMEKQNNFKKGQQEKTSSLARPNYSRGKQRSKEKPVTKNLTVQKKNQKQLTIQKKP